MSTTAQGMVARVCVVTGGAVTQLFLASSPQVEGVSGGYRVKSTAARSSPRSYDVSARKRLWQVRESLVDAALRTS